MNRPYLRRRRNRFLAYVLALGLATFCMALAQSQTALWPPLVWGFEMVLEADGFGGTLAALQYFLIADLAPFFISIAVFAIVAFGAAFAATVLLLMVFPLRFHPYIDGVVGMGCLVLVFEALTIGAAIRGAFGNVGAVVFYWLMMMSTSTIVWRYLPFALYHKSSATRSVPLPLNDVADRLVPGRAPHIELADIDMLNAAPLDGQAEVHMRMQPDLAEGEMAFDLRIEAQRGFVTVQLMRYHLAAISDEETRVNIETVLEGLSPMTLWDFWSRPFAEDFADHIVARLTQCADRSVYGRMQTAARRRLERKNAKTASA